MMTPRGSVIQLAPTAWWRRARWQMASDYPTSTGHVVPAGFVSDGASVPWFFRWFVSPTGRLFYPGIYHDYLLSIDSPWVMAAKLMRREMDAHRVPLWLTLLTYRTVRAWGRVRGYR